MSALGQKQTFAPQYVMSALPPTATAKADMREWSCLLYPQKQTCAVHSSMSALGQKQTSTGLERPSVARVRNGCFQTLPATPCDTNATWTAGRNWVKMLALEETTVPRAELLWTPVVADSQWESRDQWARSFIWRLSTKADMCAALRHVCFRRKADLCGAAKIIVIRSPRRRVQARTAECEAERFRGFEIDDHLVFGRRLHRHIGWLSPFRIRST